MHTNISEILSAVFGTANVFEAVRNYGYLFIAVGTFFEGELVLILGGFFANLGVLKLPVVIFFGFIGAVLGDNFWYFVGSTGGLRLLRGKFGGYLRITEDRIAKAEQYFKSHGKKTIFFSRFVFGTRITTAVFAGAMRMQKSEFLKANIFGALVWAVIISALGYFFGKSLRLLKVIVHRTELALLILVIVAIILFILRLVLTGYKNKRDQLEP